MELSYYDTQQRYNELMALAVELSNLSENAIAKSRRRPNIIWRFCILLTLRKEGHSYMDISRTVQMNHSTIVHDCNTMRDLIRYNPSSEYNRIWRIFVSSISDPIVEKKYITTITQINKWLNNASASTELKAKLLSTISTIEI